MRIEVYIAARLRQSHFPTSTHDIITKFGVGGIFNMWITFSSKRYKLLAMVLPWQVYTSDPFDSYWEIYETPPGINSTTGQKKLSSLISIPDSMTYLIGTSMAGAWTMARIWDVYSRSDGQNTPVSIRNAIPKHQVSSEEVPILNVRRLIA
jgi:hypothetical protein